MDFKDIDLNFTGSDEEFKALLDEKVANGEMSQDVADVFYIALLTRDEKPEATEITSTDPAQEVKEETPEKTFLEQLMEEQNPSIDYMSLRDLAQEPVPMKSPIEAAAGAGDDFISLAREVARRVNPITAGGAAVEDLAALTNLFNAGEEQISGLRDEDLQARATLGDTEALAEIAKREELSSQSFMESLMDPRTHERLPGTIIRGGAQMAMMPQALGGLVGTGVEALTGLDVGGQAALLSYDERMKALEEALGVSPALSPIETIAESLPGLAAPGGVMARLGGLTMDFMADQTIRELTDNPGEKYETVFDRIGLTNNNAAAVLAPAAAVGAVLLGGALSAKLIDNLITTRVRMRNVVSERLKDIDPDAPKDIISVERAHDLTLAQTVDEQQALKNILARHGIPDYDRIDAMIDTDTHAAMSTRIQEALKSGKLSTPQATFDVSTPPRVLYDAYQSLDPQTRDAVAQYILLKDRLDDMNIMFGRGQVTPQQLARVTAAIARLEKAYPIVKEFSARYNDITAGLRRFGEGSLFSATYRQHLDTTRPNYVALDMSSVDPSAPIMRRLEQAQREGRQGRADPEWFLQNRALGSQQDMARRVDPFDMLIESVEATLAARMRNDVRLAIVAQLRKGDVHQSFKGKKKYAIRRRRQDEEVSDPSRLVTLYRNGVKEEYLTSKLLAQLLRFDPYVAKYPGLFLPRKIAEQSMVGPLSITFAPVTFLRDAIGGAVMATDRLKPGTIGDLAMAVPEQLWSRAQRAISNSIKESMITDKMHWSQMLSNTERTRLADNMAQSYTQTLYHQANMQGGFSAAEMLDRIKLGKGVLTELADSIRRGVEPYDYFPIRATRHTAANLIDGFVAVFSSIAEGPRYASLRRMVREGTPVDEAATMSRRLTGDVTRSGRVYQATGEALEVDAVDSGALSVANPYIGGGTELIRESTIFVNPMIQGNRQLLRAIIQDPVGFNLRAWAYVGLPTLAMFAWNEMLGKEYNDYAMNLRSGADVVMKPYIGIPGRPPEEGIEFPLSHELLMWSAPFTRSMYAMARGESTEFSRGAFAEILKNIALNTIDIDTPVSMQLVFNASGMNAGDRLLDPGEGVYRLRDDHIGVLPENIEEMVRTQFAQVGDTAINVINAVAGDPSFETLYTELWNNTADRAPILQNVMGLKRSNPYFSIPTAQLERKVEVAREIHTFFDRIYNPKRLNEDELQKPGSSRTYTSLDEEKGPVVNEDFPYLIPGPEPIVPPTNPLYPLLAPILTDATRTNAMNWSGLQDRDRKYGTYLKRLREYNSGHAEAIREWQAQLEGIEPLSEDTAELQSIIRENNLDLSKYRDRVKLINHISQLKFEVTMAQVAVIDKAEEAVREILRGQGMIDEAEEFDFVTHMADPYDANPFD